MDESKFDEQRIKSQDSVNPIPLTEFKSLIEKHLRESLGTTERDSHIAKFAGKLSTDPKRVDPSINSENIQWCGDFSLALQRALAKDKIKSTVMGTGTGRSSGHLYLVAQIEDDEIIVDASIGQYLTDHLHTFIGTREELRKLVVQAFNESTINTNTNVGKLPDSNEIFERIYGSSSKKYMGNRIFNDQGEEIGIG